MDPEKEIAELQKEVKALKEQVAGIKPIVIQMGPASEEVASKDDLKRELDELRKDLASVRSALDAKKAEQGDYLALEKRVSDLEAKKEPAPAPVQTVAPAPAAAAPQTIVVNVQQAPAPTPAPAPAPTPIVIAAPEAAPAPVVEAEPEEEPEEDNGLNIVRKSFAEKMLTATQDVFDDYNVLANEFRSYKKVAGRLSFPCDSYRGHRKLYAKIIVCQKSIKLFLALDPKKYADSPIPMEDASDKKTYQDVPALFRVKSDLSIKRAKQLIHDMLTADGFEQKKDGADHIDFAEQVREIGRDDQKQRLAKEKEAPKN
jgi:hypothetical protein